MSGKVVCDISISADGYVAGPCQTADKPFGDGPVDLLHTWMFDTADENKAEVEQITRFGAYVMAGTCSDRFAANGTLTGRAGGDDPPYHAPYSCSPTIHATR